MQRINSRAQRQDLPFTKFISECSMILLIIIINFVQILYELCHIKKLLYELHTVLKFCTITVIILSLLYIHNITERDE